MSFVYIKKEYNRLIIESGKDPKDFVNKLLERELIKKGSIKGEQNG